MTFAERMKDVINKGLAASKDLAGRAGEKARELGTKGMLRLEILQLRSRMEKLTAKLGIEVYAAFAERKDSSVSRDSPEIAGILEQIEELRAAVERKENEFRAVGGKESDLVPTDTP
jgi:hypothetical protein